MPVTAIVDGQYAYLTLNDACEIFIDIQPEDIKMFCQPPSGQSELIWQMKFPYPLCYNEKPMEVILDRIVKAVQFWERIEDTEQSLRYVEILVKDFFRSKELKVEDCWHVIEDYSKKMELVPDALKAAKVIELTYPKKEVEDAFRQALAETSDSKLKTALSISINSLALFNDNGVMQIDGSMQTALPTYKPSSEPTVSYRNEITSDKAPLEYSLRDIPVFKSLPETDIRQLACNIRIIRCKKGQSLFYKGDETTMDLYIVLAGRIKASLSDENGSKVILSTFCRGDFLGETSLFGDTPRSATVTAEEDSLLGMLKHESFLDVIKKNPMIAIQMLSTVVKRSNETNAMVESIAFSAVDKRLMKYFTQLAKTEGEKTPKGSYRLKKVTQRELASQIGSSREAVSKALQLLSRKGKVVEEQGYFVISSGI
ncbi:MAG: Crp/Fnr family transcriptional regulator [Nitrospirae bacterium]|nr:Crp/Fnr family transcriptional regulator [Nitrospirota bacterium]